MRRETIFVPSVIHLTGGGKTRRRVGLPSLSDLTVEKAPAGGERRCRCRPSVSGLAGGEEGWRSMERDGVAYHRSEI